MPFRRELSRELFGVAGPLWGATTQQSGTPLVRVEPRLSAGRDLPAADDRAGAAHGVTSGGGPGKQSGAPSRVPTQTSS